MGPHDGPPLALGRDVHPLCRAAYERPPTKTGGASIVNVSSVAAVGPGYSPTAYAVAKAGVKHLTKMAAADLAQFGIRVNAIQPGFINTNIFTTSLEIPEEQKTMAKGMIAQMSVQCAACARGGMPIDIAEACAYLASEAAGFVNGTSLLVDGGLTIGPRYSWDEEEPELLDASSNWKRRQGTSCSRTIGN